MVKRGIQLARALTCGFMCHAGTGHRGDAHQVRHRGLRGACLIRLRTASVRLCSVGKRPTGWNSCVLVLQVIDSVAALVPKAELEGDMGDHHIALQVRAADKLEIRPMALS